MQSARLKEVAGLNETDGRESPIRAADVLILNWGNGAFLNPVDGLELHLRVETLTAELSIALMIAHQKLSLGVRPVGVPVVGDPRGVWLGAEMHNRLIHLRKFDQSETVLLE